MKTFALPIAALACLLLSGCRSTADIPVVSGFELNRYVGTWYEVARFPHRFEKNLTAVTAQYSLNPDGSLKVVNRGYHPEKETWKEARAVGKFRDDPTRGWLEVSFFRPFYADYKIIHLDADYREAIITGPSRNYLWILSRDPVLPDEELDRLIRTAQRFGFDTNRIERIDQTPHL
jgi:apolipoprotein D and lipocalin family protein